MKKLLIGIGAGVLGTYLYIQHQKSKEEPLNEIEDMKRPSVKKTVDDRGLVVFEVGNPNLSEKGIDYSPIAYYGADLCIDPQEINGDFESLTFPKMVVDNFDVYVSILGEYQDRLEGGIDQIASIELSGESGDRSFTKEALVAYAKKHAQGVLPDQLSIRFHAKQKGNYALTRKKVEYHYPLEIKFKGDANTRLILSIWSRIDVDEESDTYETVYYVNKH